MERKRNVSVTHFINPSLFWYHDVGDCSEQLQIIQSIEAELNELYRNKPKTKLEAHHNIGHRVAVRYLAWNRFIRAQILHTYSGRYTEYILWALDYGFPFESKLEYIHHLPERLNYHVDYIRCGGLYGLMPAEKEFDYESETCVITQQEQWHRRACEAMEKCIADARLITFEVHSCAGNGTAGMNNISKVQFWGEMKFVNQNGANYHASRYMVSTNLAIEVDKELFIEKFLTTKMIKIMPWQNNSLEKHYTSNNVGAAMLERESNEPYLDRECDIVAKRKVDDWCRRNARASHNAFESSMFATQYEEPTQLIEDDITCDDSVSVADRRRLTAQSNAANCTYDIETASHPYLMESVQKSKLKYENGCIPQLPDEYAYQIHCSNGRREKMLNKPLTVETGYGNDTNMLRCASPNSNSSALAVSTRMQKLIEIRKKRLSKTQENLQEQQTAVVANAFESEMMVAQRLENMHLSARHRKLAELRQRNSSEFSNTKSKYELTTNGKHAKIFNTEEMADCNSSKHSSNDNKCNYVNKPKHTTSPFEFLNVSNTSNAEKKSDLYFKEFTVLPAGFDVANLNNYKDENHWHCRKTTINDSTPQAADMQNTKRKQLNKNVINQSSSSSDFFNDYCNDVPSTSDKNHNHIKSSNGYEKTNSQTSSFQMAENDSKETKILTATNNNMFEFQPKVNRANRLSDNESNRSSQLTARKSNLPTQVVSSAAAESSSSSSASSTSRLKRRQLKSPAMQNQVIQQILRSAKHEKMLGNEHILELSVNRKVCGNRTTTDSDSTGELFSADSGSDYTDFVQTASNKRALTMKCSQKQKNRNLNSNGDDLSSSHSNNKSSKLLNTVPKNAQRPPSAKQQQYAAVQLKEDRVVQNNNKSPEQEKLELLAQRLKAELQLGAVTTSSAIPKSLKSLLQQGESSNQLREIQGEAKLQTNFIEHLVLAHSCVPLRAVDSLSDAYFYGAIHDEMVNMRFNKVYRIQSYGWSYLISSNSLFLVNPAKTGKTWCYLPAVCSLVCYRILGGTVPDTYGPVAIILVPSSTRVELITNYCRRLLLHVKGSKISTVPCYGRRNANETKTQLLNACGILVATPSSILRLMQDDELKRLFDPDRLQHLVVDDMNIMLKRSQDDTKTVLNMLYKLTPKLSGKKLSLQLIVTTGEWNSLMRSMIRSVSAPLLIIGDFLEAAVYGRAKITIKVCRGQEKTSKIVHYIEQHPLEMGRMIILCNEDYDVEEVSTSLISAGYVCLAYDSNSPADVLRTIDEWKKKLSTQIVICTDASFPELQIQNALSLVHYSMPKSWTKFTVRFSAISKSYTNYVVKGFDAESAHEPGSLILLDEENNLQLPSLIDFMQKHNQSVHPDLIKVSKRVLIQREEERIFKGTRMCRKILEFGECDETRCNYRHNFTRFDVITKSDEIPLNGDLRITILKVFSPTHFSVRMLSQKHPGENKWHAVRRSNKAVLFGMQLNMHHLNTDNNIMNWPLRINDLCIYKYNDNYQRARILEASSELSMSKVRVCLRLIDLGVVLSEIKADELLQCDAQFKQFPAQAVDMRLMGIVPYDNEKSVKLNSPKGF